MIQPMSQNNESFADAIQANRKMWDETADVHADVKLQGLLDAFKTPDFTTIDEIEQRMFDRIDLNGKAVAQLSCNNGRELICVKRAGAGRCVGFDISEKFVGQGRQLAEAAGVEVEFVRSNVYDIGEEYTDAFDVIYVTIGALGWLPDLDTYFKIIRRLLRDGGHFFLYEMHPVLDMFDAETGLEIKHSYFRTKPFIEENVPDYYDNSQVVSSVSYWFHHKLSDIIGGCLKNGLTLLHFEEHPHDISEVFKAFQDFDHKPPMSYSLLAQKQG